MKPLNTKEFRDSILRKFKDKKIPVMGTFEITGRCNFDCKMCYVHTKSNAEFAKTERDGDWWISVMDEAYNQGMLFALLTGGECLLHPDFKRIYTHLRSKGVYTSINTNGFLLTHEMIDFLKRNPPFEIQVTLYGTDDDSYYRVTGSRAFSRVCDNILYAKEAGLNLKVAVTPNPHSGGETVRIIKYLMEQSIPLVINEALHTTREESSTHTLSENQVEVDEQIQYLSVIKDAELEPKSIENLPPIGGGRTDQIRGMRCSGGKAAFFLTNDGLMLPCPTAHMMRIPLNCPEDFAAAWDALREETYSFLQPIECEGCAYKKVCLSCPFLRNGKAVSGHCDPKVCEVTRRLVASGVKKLPDSKET